MADRFYRATASGGVKTEADEIVDALEKALAGLVDAKALAGVREQVAGWNGEGQPDGPYERHPSRLGARIETNCGAVYELDEALTAGRAALRKARGES